MEVALVDWVLLTPSDVSVASLLEINLTRMIASQNCNNDFDCIAVFETIIRSSFSSPLRHRGPDGKWIRSPPQFWIFLTVAARQFDTATLHGSSAQEISRPMNAHNTLINNTFMQHILGTAANIGCGENA
ncbi:hypothetical protein MRS76_12085 [Rhizobiaceae bacterium n13]|uniref:Uncharacterized protein n=1 Tax=Ferirhizobium litorale TaxID=2927786 RepID=A0AAE3U594_9HYPH|nr:hypothetical protein [Fererhizobium litorale]MDI7862698.1 hypothetical protein [Fererhizobium litorale]MDI7923819.1 hypothetical protein [Fererhizobium litorale]